MNAKIARKKRKTVVNEDLFLDCLKHRVEGLFDPIHYRTLDKEELMKEFKLRVDFLRSWVDKHEHLVKDNEEYRAERAHNDQIS